MNQATVNNKKRVPLKYIKQISFTTTKTTCKHDVSRNTFFKRDMKIVERQSLFNLFNPGYK